MEIERIPNKSLDGHAMVNILEHLPEYIDDYFETEIPPVEYLVNMTNLLIKIGEQYSLFDSEQKTKVYTMLFERIRLWIREGYRG